MAISLISTEDFSRQSDRANRVREGAVRLSIIIPIYNEESTVGEVIAQVLAVDLAGIEKEIIVVNDGSTDGTAKILQKAEERNADLLTVHTSEQNFGKGMAIRAGMNYARGDVILIQDADLELNPKEYGLLLEPILSGKSSVVYGSRFLNPENKIPWKSRLAQRLLTPLTNLLYGANLTDEATAYKVFRRDVLKNIDLHCVRFEFCPEVTAKVLKHGHTIVEVPISYHPRSKSEGKKLCFLKDGLIAIYTLLKYRFSD